MKYKLYKNTLGKKILSVAIGLASLTGVVGTNIGNIIPDSSIVAYAGEEDQTVYVGDDYIYDVGYAYSDAIGKYTELDNNVPIKYLEKIEKIDFCGTDCNLSWLSYCFNLKEITIDFYSQDQCEIFSKVSFDYIETLNLNIDVRDNYALHKFFANLKNIHIKNLVLSVNSNCDLGNYDFLSNLKVENISLNLDGYSYPDVRLDSFLGIKKLTLNAEYPYELAIYLSKDLEEQFKESGTSIIFDMDEEQMKKYKSARDKLDSIYNSIEITDKMSDDEKIDAILSYVLEHYAYDEEIGSLIYEQGSKKTQKNPKLREKYTEGTLTPIMKENEGIVCGNYTALFSSLLNRAGIHSYYMSSNVHAWNLVEVDNEYYYYDATWLDDSMVHLDPVTKEGKMIITDGKIEYKYEGGKSFLSEDFIERNIDPSTYNTNLWYKVLLKDYGKKDENNDHDAKYIPDYVEIAQEKEASQIKKKLVVNYDGEEYYIYPDGTYEKASDVKEARKEKAKEIAKKAAIPASALMGLMVALGVAIPVTKKKKREKQERMAKYTDQIDPYSYIYPSSQYDPNNGYGGYDPNGSSFGGRNY